VVLHNCLERGVEGSGAVAKMRHTTAVAIAGMADMAAAAIECTIMAADVVEVGQVTAARHVGAAHAGRGDGG